MSSEEFFELKNLLLEQRALLNILIPNDVPISYISDRTGKTRQAIRDYLHCNHQENRDFYLKKGKIYIARETAIRILQRSKI
jgi:hypothetical protein